MGGGSRGNRISYSNQQKKMNHPLMIYADREGAEKPKRKVFISFHMEDEYAKELLSAQARSEKFSLEFINYSINEPFDEKWKEQCRERIAMTSVLIVLIGLETYMREAVNWEINEAYRQGKTVIGVRIHRHETHRVPQQMLDNDAKIMNWDIDEISKELSK